MTMMEAAKRYMPKTNYGPTIYRGPVANQLDCIARQILRALEWTKQERDKEGLSCDYNADIHFPVDPNYPQFVEWLKTLERAIAIVDEKERGAANG